MANPNHHLLLNDYEVDYHWLDDFSKVLDKHPSFKCTTPKFQYDYDDQNGAFNLFMNPETDEFDISYPQKQSIYKFNDAFYYDLYGLGLTDENKDKHKVTYDEDTQVFPNKMTIDFCLFIASHILDNLKNSDFTPDEILQKLKNMSPGHFSWLTIDIIKNVQYAMIEGLDDKGKRYNKKRVEIRCVEVVSLKEPDSIKIKYFDINRQNDNLYKILDYLDSTELQPDNLSSDTLFYFLLLVNTNNWGVVSEHTTCAMGIYTKYLKITNQYDKTLVISPFEVETGNRDIDKNNEIIIMDKTTGGMNKTQYELFVTQRTNQKREPLSGNNRTSKKMGERYAREIREHIRNNTLQIDNLNKAQQRVLNEIRKEDKFANTSPLFPQQTNSLFVEDLDDPDKQNTDNHDQVLIHASKKSKDEQLETDMILKLKLF